MTTNAHLRPSWDDRTKPGAPAQTDDARPIEDQIAAKLKEAGEALEAATKLCRGTDYHFQFDVVQPGESDWTTIRGADTVVAYLERKVATLIVPE